jgi:hypothetical protein
MYPTGLMFPSRIALAPVCSQFDRPIGDFYYSRDSYTLAGDSDATGFYIPVLAGYFRSVCFQLAERPYPVLIRAF